MSTTPDTHVEPWPGTISDLVAAIRHLPYGDQDAYTEIDAEIEREAEEAEARKWLAAHRARREAEQARKPRRIAGGSVPAVRRAMREAAYSLSGQFIDHRGMTWTAVTGGTPDTWRNESTGVYRSEDNLATYIARGGGK